MGYYADIYAIKRMRSTELGVQFLERFLPERAETFSTYQLPRFGRDVTFQCNSALELMNFLEKHEYEHHAIYWRNLDKTHANRFGMIFYTPDGCMIFGLSRNHDHLEEEGLQEMFDFLDTDEGYITYECPPEDTYEDFLKVMHGNVKVLQPALAS